MDIISRPKARLHNEILNLARKEKKQDFKRPARPIFHQLPRPSYADIGKDQKVPRMDLETGREDPEVPKEKTKVVKKKALKTGQYKLTLFILFCVILIPAFAFLFWKEAQKDSEEDPVSGLVEDMDNSAGKNASSAVSKKQSAPPPSSSPAAAASPPATQNNPPVPSDIPENETINDENIPEENSSEESNPEESSNEGWKTYEEKGYEFKHSENAKVSSVGSYILIKTKEQELRLKVYENEEKQELEAWYGANFSEKERKDCVFESASVKIGTYETKIAKASSAELDCGQVGYWALNSEKDLVARVRMDGEPKEEAKKILETFKFKN